MPGYRTIGYPPIPESNFSAGDFSPREVNALFETHECLASPRGSACGAVGATNQAGDATGFTSYGKTVAVYASGYHVESFVPGGKRVRLSGTSMAAPQVTNLAGKLFAVDPALTPEKAKELILDGATLSDDGKRKLIDEKKTLELVKEKKTTAKVGAEKGGG
jgi:subtilisin family serine protease